MKHSKETKEASLKHTLADSHNEDWPIHELESVLACPVCGSRNRETVLKGLTDTVFCSAPGVWTLIRCHSCGSAWIDPRPTRESIGKAYKNYYTHLADGDPRARPKSLLVRQLHSWQRDYQSARYGSCRAEGGRGGRWLVPLIPSLKAKADAKMRHLPSPQAGAARLLDVGSGSGDFLKRAEEMGWIAEGIDFDPLAVKLARSQGLTVFHSPVDELPFEPSSYDVITLSHVIEHVHDPRSLLQRLEKLLKPGGLLWIETPNLDSLGFKRFGKFWRGLEIPRHLVLFNPHSLRKLLETTGFTTIKQHWHGTILFSIYAESAAMQNEICAGEAKPSLIQLFSWILDEAREMFQPQKREFITFSARKPGVQLLNVSHKASDN